MRPTVPSTIAGPGITAPSRGRPAVPAPAGGGAGAAGAHRARGTARPLWPGRIFRLDLFPREAENDDYLVTACRYRLWDDQFRSGQSRAEVGYEVDLSLVPARVPYRPERRTPRPVMKGPQTASWSGPRARRSSPTDMRG